METFQKIVDEADGKLALFVLFKRLPGPVPKLSPGVLVFYDGPEARAKEILAPLYDIGPIMNMATTKPYADTTKMAPHMGGPPTHQRYSTSFVRMPYPFDIEVLQSLADDLNAFIDKYGAAALDQSKLVFEIRSYKKVLSVPNSATASNARRPGMDTMLEAQFDSSVELATMRAEIVGMMEKVRTELARKNPEQGLPVNPNLAIGGEKAAQVFGENLPRLRELKKKYDPGFVFNKWYPIPPAE